MDLIAKLCALPVHFKSRRDVSVDQLVGESGYHVDPEALSVEAVSAHLREHPELVEVWLAYSEDKRTSSGWYIVPGPGDTFEVAFYPEGERLSMKGRVHACAEFIVREVRSIAG